MIKKSVLTACGIAAAISVSASDPVLRMDMDPVEGTVTEAVSGACYAINGVHRGEAVSGYTGTGKGTRFDGYSTYIEGEVGDVLASNRRKATFSVWVAPETYPLIAMRETTPTRIPLFGVFGNGGDVALWLGQNGEYSFMCQVGGEKVEPQFRTPLPCSQWSNITGVIDGNAGIVRMYVNGELVSEESCARGEINFKGGRMFIGRGIDPVNDGVFGINYFNGIIDDITIYNDIVVPGKVKPNDLVIAVPAERFANDILRPAYHGMPSANWTNEPHGLIYTGGKYHLFHQRNANGTYMGRQHWGHLISENLYDWTEAPVALFPDKDGYDLWGCWSGCAVNDPRWNNGVPQLIYTGVNYSRASIAYADVADATDPNLVKWNKKGTIVDHTPDGFSDFRDPIMFNANGKWYMVIGCGRNGKGCLVLCRYENGRWTNDGTVFLKDDNANLGEFWEMPTVNQIDGKWVVTVSTINSGDNNTYYWVGDINADGTFTAKTPARKVELDNFAVSGYGMMSPSILQKDGKTIAIGIVPDKLPSAEDVRKGWSHLFSLPRELSVSSDNYLYQRPYEGLRSMRGANSAAGDGAQTLNVNGRRFEASAIFTAPASGRFGYSIFKTGSKGVDVYFDMTSQKFYVDASKCDRILTDADGRVSPNGVFSSKLPRNIAAGQDVKLNIFVDNSIIDIFINEQWASSVRIFSTDPNARGAEVFGDGAIKNVEAYNLNVRGYIAGLPLRQNAIEGGEPVVPAPDVPLDPTGRYEVDANGRDVKLKNISGMNLGILLRGNENTLNAHERAAYDYFMKECGNGRIYTDATSAAINAAGAPRVIWVHVDADGDSSMPFSSSTISNLSQFVKDGGSLYLSGFATQLVEKIGRTTGFAPNEINLNGGDNPDIWTINVVADDADNHYLADNLDKLSGKNVANYPVIGGLAQGEFTYRMDHNCLWLLERLYGGRNWSDPSSKNDFENDTESKVLATWGRDEFNYGNAGIVEFYPNAQFKGTVVANGIAGANQFVHTKGDNAWDYNQKRLVNNILFALHGPGSSTGVDDIPGTSEQLTVEAVGGTIVYGGASAGSVATIADISGRVMAQVAVSGSGVIDLGCSGVVIVNVKSLDNKVNVFKLVVRP